MLQISANEGKKKIPPGRGIEKRRLSIFISL
jgi:hypothetical protein